MISKWPPTSLARTSPFWLCLAIFVSYLTPASARESIENTPSALLVTAFFDRVIEITFPRAQGSGNSLQAEPDSNGSDKTVPAEAETQAATISRQEARKVRADALRQVLSRSIDAEAIAQFILGRYAAAAGKDRGDGRTTRSVPRPSEGFLDFATATITRMGPKSSPSDSTTILRRPTLSILDMTIRPDQRRLVSSELKLPNGQILPLIWEVAARPDGLKIEDVDCYGISLRLLLRSAVAQAAAERPDDVTDLGALLGAGDALGGASHLQGIP